MATANDVITGAYGKLAVYQSTDAIPPEDVTLGLNALNKIINSVSANGGLTETVALAVNDPLPVADQNIEDLEWFLARRLAPNHGKQIVGDAYVLARMGEERFKAAYIKVYPATPDGGLRNMPSQRRWGSNGNQLL